MTGNKYQREVDMPALPGVLGLEIVRHYNSFFSSPTHSNGLVGRGWKLSYETDLQANGRTIQILQADGKRITFDRDPRDPSLCTTASPAHGSVRIVKTARGDEYTWTWENGRRLSFNTRGRLVQIAAPTGEFVSMQHDAAGMLLSVTDPQGRSLQLRYLGRKDQFAGDRFRGVQSIDSPVGRFTYFYGSALPKGAALDKLHVLANMVGIGFPGGQSGRLYHYEDAAHPTLLTGISVEGRGKGGAPLRQRISTFAYDGDRRGVLTVRGEPARLERGADGQPVQPARLAAGTGIDQVTLDMSVAGRTVVSNSLGQKTVYRHAIIGGEYRLLEVRGAGCSSCAEPNIRYGYDRAGRLTEVTRLATNGDPVSTETTELDRRGRAVKQSRIVYRNGKPGPAEWLQRVEFGADQAARVVTRPSVVPGKETQTRIVYNDAGQPLTVTQVGWSPALNGKSEPERVERITTYRYASINGRSLLTQIDGPLPNGATNSPLDSDITVFEYDKASSGQAVPNGPATPATLAQYGPSKGQLSRIVAPGNFVTEILERDTALRPTKIRTTDGDKVHVATVESDWRGAPLSIDLAAGGLARRFHYAYDYAGQLVAVSLPGELRTAFEYDRAGRMNKTILPDGSEVHMARDTEGRIARILRALDGQQIVMGQTLPDVQFGYDRPSDAPGRLAQVRDAEGIISSYRYNDVGQLIGTTNALGTASQYGYNEAGLVSSRIDAFGTSNAALTRTAYDKQGRATLIIAPNAVATYRQYDDFGNKVLEVDPDHGATLYRYDLAGHLIARVDDTLTITRFTYDNADRLLAVGDEKSPDLTQYQYKGRWLASRISTPDGKPERAIERTEYLRDAFGQVVRESRWVAGVTQRYPSSDSARGVTFVTANQYDMAGRLVRQTLPDDHVLEYRYAASTAGAIAPRHHRPGQLEAVLFDGKAVVTEIEQTTVGGLTAYTMSNGARQKIALDGRGRIERLQVMAGSAAQAGWFNSMIAWFGRPAAGHGESLYQQTNRYDSAGRIVHIDRQLAALPNSREAPLRTDAYDYDHMDRLTRHVAADGNTVSYEYDKAGNRLAESYDPAPTMAGPATARLRPAKLVYKYTEGSNRLFAIMPDDAGKETQPVPPVQAPTSTVQAAQLAGSMLLYHPTGVPLAQLRWSTSGAAQASRRTVYNTAKRPVAVYRDDQLLVSYYYNTVGERIAKTVYSVKPTMVKVALVQDHGETTYSLYRDQLLAAEADGAGKITAHYIYLYGKPVAKVEMRTDRSSWHRFWQFIGASIGVIDHDSASIYSVVTDHLGTPQEVFDDRKQVVWRASTAAFGRASVEYGAEQGAAAKPFQMNLRLPGQVFDAETGLHYNYLRDYDPDIGRYLTPDPMGIDAGLNSYAYAAGNPLTKIDPFGLYEVDIHYYMTYTLAKLAGVSTQDALIMALATQYVDDNFFTTPIAYTALDTQSDRLSKYHFTQDGYDPAIAPGQSELNYEYKRINNPNNPQLDRLLAGANKATNSSCSKTQLFGEYLHAFEDTFGHRDDRNATISVASGLGHATYGHEPDKTYNAIELPLAFPRAWANWAFREERTLRMEEEVFNAIKLQFGTKGSLRNNVPVQFMDIAPFLREFNATHENEENTNALFNNKNNRKRMQLKELLSQFGFPDVPDYDVAKACQNRQKYIPDSGLKPADFPGLILTTQAECPANR